MLPDSYSVTRRRALLGAGAAVTGSLAGCLSAVFGDEAGPPPFADWLGPDLVPDDARGTGDGEYVIEPFLVGAPSTVASADGPAVIEELVLGQGWFDPDSWPITLPADATDLYLGVELVTGVELDVFEGSFDPERVIASLPDDAERPGTDADAEIHTIEPDASHHSGAAVGVTDDAVVVALRGESDGARIGSIQRALAIRGEAADSYVDTKDQFAQFVEHCGTGYFVHARPLRRDLVACVRMQEDGRFVDRRSVWAFRDETAARDFRDSAVETIETRSSDLDENEVRTWTNKYAVYRNVDVRRDGPVVVFDARVPRDDVKALDISHHL